MFLVSLSWHRSEFAKLRRYHQGRIVTNKDSEDNNCWVHHSELGTAGRPLTHDKILMPLSRELVLPESLDADDGIRVAERQRPSPETVAAQKGKARWVVLLRSLCSMQGYDLTNKPVVVVNFTSYVEDVGCAASGRRFGTVDFLVVYPPFLRHVYSTQYNASSR